MTNANARLRFFVVAIPALLILFALHWLDRRMAQHNWQQHMQDSVAEMRRGLTTNFHEVSADTLTLASDTGLRHALPGGNMAAIAPRFKAMARYKPQYQQIRYIDQSGMERVRVDVRADQVVQIPEKELQDKSSRDYFREASSLPDGSLRLSRLDLNIEHGQIELPFRPMLRFSSPVFDDKGVRRGIIVINYAIGPLLERFDRATPDRSGNLMLLNSRGSWLAGGAPQQRWGDVLGNSNGFAAQRPAAWKDLQDKGEQQPRQIGDYLYAASALHPADLVRASLDASHITLSSADPWWMLVSEADMREVYAEPRKRLMTGAALLALALLLWGFTARGWSKLKLSVHESQKLTRRLAQVVEQTSDVVFTTDPSGRINYVNQSFCDVTGYNKQEALAKNPALLKSGLHSEAFYKTLWGEITEGRTFRDLFINRRSDSSLYYEEKTISPLIDENGKPDGYVSTGKDVTDSKMMKLAFYDQLTGLVNRVLFLDRLEYEMRHASRNNRHIAVLYMDLDGFKAVNDTLGHQAGDEVLKEFARRIGNLMRRSDTFARLGGDEFAILLKEIGPKTDAAHFAEKVIAAMKEEWLIEGQPCKLGVSIGISYHPDETSCTDNLLARADIAMYSAKRAGKNRYAEYEKEVSQEA